MQDFSDMKLVKPILNALREEKYMTPTPIQEKCIPLINEGVDLLGVAQTGTGKTAAFALPLLNCLEKKVGKPIRRHPNALILAPTRELACQIEASLKTYGRHLQLRSSVVFGGASIRPQIQKLNNGIHILVATPGRLIDLMRQGHVNLSKVEIFVLDEADRMLDMGFIPDVRKISKSLSIGRQTIMFSATMPVSVKRLADTLLKDPEYIETTPSSTTVEKIDQCMLFLSKDKKRFMLGELLADDALKKVLIFTRTKHCADRVVKNLHQVNIRADAIHGNKAQSVRQRALKSFRSGNIRALVATDIAARGIDVEGVTHVINFELPNDPENYVHRIGRTARAGATGIAISFCDHSERGYLREIEKIIRQKIPINADHPYHLAEIVSVPSSAQKKSRPHRKGVGKRNSKFKNKLKQNIEGAPRGRKAA